MKLLLTEALQTHIDAIDDEHRVLIDLINEAMQWLLRREDDSVAFGDWLIRLRVHADRHFAIEEALLERHAVDARHAEAHREAHRDLLRQLAAFIADGALGPEAAAKFRLLAMLIEWLCFHLLDVDQHMAGQIRLIEAGMLPAMAYDEQKRRAQQGSVRVRRIDTLAAIFATLSEFMATAQREPEVNRVAPRDALPDQLTGLPGRHRFIDELQQLLTAMHGHDDVVVVLHLDVDGMRGINQSRGMAFADRLLVDIARHLREAARRQDLLARIGGDDFALALSGGDDVAALVDAAQRLYQVVGRSLMANADGCTLAAGIAVWPRDGAGGEEILMAAERALDQAKQAGGGCLRKFDNSAPQGGVCFVRRDAAEELRKAIRDDELILHYQPQLALYSGEIVGCEALVRWQHKDRGLVQPCQFIPLAEESGLVVPLGEWVVKEALAQSRRWQDAGLPPVRVSVNISPQQLRQEALVGLIEQQLGLAGVAPHLLEMELTESAMADDPIAVIAVVDRLKALGVRLALDDFGTGYSSLAYLSRFAIDLLKIDQSFVRDITRNPVNSSIVAATIAMAHKLGQSVIAEGVETVEQMHYLRRHDCDEMQGYLFSRPVPADEFAGMLRNARVLDVLPAAESELPCLLLVDDEPNVLQALKRLLRREGYRILTAQSGVQGLDLLASNRIEVVLSDQRMPEMTGSEFLGRVKAMHPNTVRMVLSGYSELAAVTDAVNRGAIYKFLYKPWNDEVLKKEIRHAFRYQKELSPHGPHPD